MLVAAVLLLLAPAAAAAQSMPRTDPEAGSPAEAVYGIPFEEARRDAAPGILPGTAIRTENSVGSSSRVPGRGREPSAAGPTSDPGRRAERRRERQAARAAARISGEPSAAATIVLLVLVVATAAAGGVGAGRLVGRRARL